MCGDVYVWCLVVVTRVFQIDTAEAVGWASLELLYLASFALFSESGFVCLTLFIMSRIDSNVIIDFLLFVFIIIMTIIYLFFVVVFLTLFSVDKGENYCVIKDLMVKSKRCMQIRWIFLRNPHHINVYFFKK